jgi:hypothetical protein
VKILVPYVLEQLEPQTREWGSAGGAEFHNLTGDDEAYFRLLARLWRAGAAFMLVEQDVVPPDNAIEGLTSCARPWCSRHPRHPCSDHVDLDDLRALEFPDSTHESFMAAVGSGGDPEQKN